MEIIEQLEAEYVNAGFEVTKTDKSLLFSKNYPFEESDGQQQDVLIEVKFSKEYPILPPSLQEPNKILTSMHSLNGFQCWARFSEIFPQVGLGLIKPDIVENQIQKLIKAHKSREYYTVNESPEFASFFEARESVDHSQLYVSCEVLDSVVKAGRGKYISSVADKFANNLFGVNQDPMVSDGIFPAPHNKTGKLRVFFFNVPIVQHYDYRSDDVSFLYSLETLSGIDPDKAFLQIIEDPIIYIVVVFFNKGLNHHDVVAFSKKKEEKKLTLLQHARVSSRSVMFSRHADEFKNLAGKKVALFGIGAIGSMLGMNLLQSGIDQLHVVDNDYVDLENTSRSVYCAEDVGTKKIDAFKNRAGIKDPDFQQRVVGYQDIKDLNNKEVDIVIVCIGDMYQEYFLSRRMRKAGFEKLVFVFGQNDSTWGGVYFQDDKNLGCQHCLLIHQNENPELRIPYVPYFSEAVGCGNPSYISTPTDIGLIANIGTKLIIERLTKKQKTGPNYFIWQSNPEPHAWRDNHLDRYSLKKYRVVKHVECEC